MKSYCNQTKELNLDFAQINENERKTFWVVIITLVMMVIEIVAGHLTQSMALLADGYHMASHAGALGIAFLVYKMAKSEKIRNKLSFGTGKLLPLGGYTSAIGLGMVALWMIAESIERFLNPTPIQFNEAIGIAVIGLVINIICAFILGSEGHSHDHEHKHSHDHDDHSHNHDHNHAHHNKKVEDHNHKSALVHVITDALTSVLAIVALIFGKYFALNWLDPLMGILGAVIIFRWAYGLCVDTGKELLDAQSKEINVDDVKNKIEQTGVQILDLHIWKVGPSNHACQMVVKTSNKKGSHFYKQFLSDSLGAVHLVVEEV